MPMISLAELQRRIDSGELSANGAIDQSLEAIAAQDKTIGAFVCRAKAVDAVGAGPLRGSRWASRTYRYIGFSD